MREMALAAWMSSSWSVLVSTDSRAGTKPASPKPLRTTADRRQNTPWRTFKLHTYKLQIMRKIWKVFKSFSCQSRHDWSYFNKQEIMSKDVTHMNNLHSLASSATSLAVSCVRGPLRLRDRARMGRIPLITTCSAAPLSVHTWNYTCKHNNSTKAQ